MAERFSSRSRSPIAALMRTNYPGASVNKRVGSARSLSSGRALRGPVGALAHPTLANPPYALVLLNQWRWVAHGKGYGGQVVVNSDAKVASRFCCQKRLYGTCACGMK
jgi:hypothetical protein